MCILSEKSQQLKDELLNLIDRDAESFNLVIEAYKLPKKTIKEIKIRNSSIDRSLKKATSIPFQTLTCCRRLMDISLEAVLEGNPKSISDAAVSGEMAHAGAHGAALNIFINLKDICDQKYCNDMNKKT